MTNTKLKFIDLAYNFMDITVLHSLRRMIEKNTTLKYLSLNDLHRFNERAVESLVPSFAANQSLKMVDLKQVTREFYEFISESVNERREDRREEPIDFRTNDRFLVATNGIGYKRRQPLRGGSPPQKLMDPSLKVNNYNRPGSKIK